jgi:hypothetical protein
VVHEGTGQSGKQLIEDVRSFGEQRVRMERLGGASSSRRAVGQNVSLDHRHFGEGIGQDSGGRQSADGCTENHGLPTECPQSDPHRFDPTPSLQGSRMRRKYQRIVLTCGEIPDAIICYHRS